MLFLLKIVSPVTVPPRNPAKNLDAHHAARIEYAFYSPWMEWGPPRVRLSVPPQYGVHLLAWGADPGSRWWALVTWERYMARGFESPTRVWCSAWTDRTHVDRIDTEDYTRVPRVRLDADQRWWPAPPEPRLGHYGVLQADTALDPPTGYRWCNPRFSKRR